MRFYSERVKMRSRVLFAPQAYVNKYWVAIVGYVSAVRTTYIVKPATLAIVKNK